MEWGELRGLNFKFQPSKKNVMLKLGRHCKPIPLCWCAKAGLNTNVTIRDVSKFGLQTLKSVVVFVRACAH